MYCVHKYIVYISSLQVAPWELLTDRGLPPGHPIGHHSRAFSVRIASEKDGERELGCNNHIL